MRYSTSVFAIVLSISVSHGLPGIEPEIEVVVQDLPPIIDPADIIDLAAAFNELEPPVEAKEAVELETPPVDPETVPSDPAPSDPEAASVEPAAPSVEPTLFRQVDAAPASPACPQSSQVICSKCGKPKCGPLSFCDQFKENIRVRTHRCQCKGSERPFGTIVREYCDTQILNGRIRSMTLYQYDFYAGTLGEPANLKARGRRELVRIAQTHNDTGLPIHIETTNPELDEQRRQTVVSELESLGFVVDMNSVLVGPPAWSDLSGEEMEILNQNLDRQTRSAAQQRLGVRITNSGGGGGGGGGGGRGGGGNR